MSKNILTVTLNPAIDYTIEVPNFALDAVNRASTGRRDPGGKGVNVATALSQSGLKTRVTGFLGKSNSLIFEDHFKKNAMKDHFVYVDGPTREGIKIADPVHVITTDINFTGFNLKQSEIDKFVEIFTTLVPNADYVVLSGSLPAGVPVTIYCLLAQIARKSGAYVAIDTSGEALKMAIDSGFIDLIKPNMDELSQIFEEVRNASDKEAAVDTLSKKLLEKVGSIALSLGEEGSRLYTGDGIISATAPKIPVKSTVGAGDTFLAGFIGGLARGLDDKGALKNAAAWAASKLTMFGPGLSKEQPPGQFLDEIIIS